MELDRCNSCEPPAAANHAVPKLHPLDRGNAPADPLELIANPVGGDPELMLECLLQEFFWMGYGAVELFELFHDPAYPMLCELRALFGDDEVRKRVEHLAAHAGTIRIQEFVAEPDEELEALYEQMLEDDLVQLTLPPAHITTLRQQGT